MNCDTDDISIKVLEMHALGRNFKLGTLYDARTDQTVPGIDHFINITRKSNFFSNRFSDL
jgi:hypothetical protein